MSDKLEILEIGNTKYVSFYAACPVCLERGIHGKAFFGEHHGCGGKIYIGDNAHFYCESCEQTRHITRCKYECECECSSSKEEKATITFGTTSNVSAAAINVVLSCSGQLIGETGLPWLQKLLGNLEAGELNDKKIRY